MRIHPIAAVAVAPRQTRLHHHLVLAVIAALIAFAAILAGFLFSAPVDAMPVTQASPPVPMQKSGISFGLVAVGSTMLSSIAGYLVVSLALTRNGNGNG